MAYTSFGILRIGAYYVLLSCFNLGITAFVCPASRLVVYATEDTRLDILHCFLVAISGVSGRFFNFVCEPGEKVMGYDA